MKTKDTAIGWKCFNKNLTCQGYQFKEGETHEVSGGLEMCKTLGN